MNRILVVVLAVGGLIIAATIWRTYPRAPKSAGDPSQFRFMHCPEFKRESTYSAVGFEKPCMYCDKPLVGTVESIKVTGTSNPWKRMLAYVLAESVGLMGAVVYILYNPPPSPEMEFYYTRCPNLKCNRKMRYSANRAGAEVQCPICKTKFLNPTLEEQAAAKRSPEIGEAT